MKRSLKFSPKINNSFRPHGKWGDVLIAVIPISWCLNILSNSNFILRLVEWQAESSSLTLRVRGKQWYWVYKIDMHAQESLRRHNIQTGNQHWNVVKRGSASSQLANLQTLNNLEKQGLLDANVGDFMKLRKAAGKLQVSGAWAWYQDSAPRSPFGLKKDSGVPSDIMPQDALAGIVRGSAEQGRTSVEDIVFTWSYGPSCQGWKPAELELVWDYHQTTDKSDLMKRFVISRKPRRPIFKTVPAIHNKPLTVGRGLLSGLLPLEGSNTLHKWNFNYTGARYVNGSIEQVQPNWTAQKLAAQNYFFIIKQKRFFYKSPVATDQIIFNQSAFFGQNDAGMFTKKEMKFLYQNNIYNKRLLRTSRILVLPTRTNITVITNSFDVIHSWFVPGLGFKLDCVPGRSTHHTLHIINSGFYYGQCAEICGRYHHHMPIRICAMPFTHFMFWWDNRVVPAFRQRK